MSLTVLAWLAVGAYALHILEEHILGWFSWAKKTMNLSMDWDTYIMVEVVLLILGAIAAMLAPAMPMLALAFIAMLVINVTFFHVLPMLFAGGQFSPGAISGVLLFFPLAYYAFRASFDSSAAQTTAIWAIFIGAAIILWPMLLLWLKAQPYFSGADATPRKLAKRRR
jgi:hypothetical protein